MMACLRIASRDHLNVLTALTTTPRTATADPDRAQPRPVLESTAEPAPIDAETEPAPPLRRSRGLSWGYRAK